MGMASSQARLCALTSRNHDIGLKLEHYSLEKNSLTREMQKISKNYNQALQSKVLKWSNNAGVDYVDLTYSTLMRPNTSNGNKPVLLTNSSGKIVIDQKYKEYAKLISPDGKSGADWKNNEYRTSILSKLTGISAETISNATSSEQNVYDTHDEVNKALEERDKAEYRAFEQLNEKKFASHWGEIGGFDFASKSSGTISLGSKTLAANNLKQYIDKIAQNSEQYLTEDDYTKFKNACNEYYTSISGFITDFDKTKDSIKSGNIDITGDENNLKIDIEKLINGLMKLYELNGGSVKKDKNGNVSYKTIKGDGRSSEDYNAYLKAVENYNNMKSEYTTLVDSDNQILTADQEKIIEFYDQLFTAIAENGWIEDYEVSDNDYLNQMLQNNEYFITTMSKNDDSENYDNNGNKKTKKNLFKYDTDLWSNNEKIYQVNDEAIREQALSIYEHEKFIINEKESRIDIRMKDLETEQSAIKQMMQGLKAIIEKNTEKLNVFT